MKWMQTVARDIRPNRATGRARRALRRWRAAPLCLLLVACAAGATPVPTRLVVPPALVVITPTIIGGATAPTPAYPSSGAPAGATLVPTARSAPQTGAAAPTPPPVVVVPTRPPAPTATFDPNAPRAVKVTANGCCPQPQWLANGTVAYYGTVQGQRGTWAVPRTGGVAQFLTPQFGAFALDGQLVAYPDGVFTHVARLDGTILATWETAGRVYLAPQTGRAAWLVAAGDVQAASVSLDPPVRVAVGTIAGGAVVTLPPAFSTEHLQWFPDGRRLLVNGREGTGSNPGLWVLDTATGAATQIVAARALEQPLIAPDGRTIAYTATLQEDRAANGVWLVDADGGNRRKIPLTGGYRWAPDSASLYYVPLTLDRPTDELWRYRLADSSRTAIVGANQLTLPIAQDEWEIAPTGDALVYRSASDGALWVVNWLK